MKFFIPSIIFAYLFLIVGCDNKVIPLKNKYEDKPYEFTVSNNKDLVWNKLIDLFTKKGLAIKTIDKTDGVITTDNASFINSYTWENKDGNLINPNALVVCSKFRGPFTLGTSLTPSAITGQWIVRIKQESDKTILNVKLANAIGKISIGDTGLNGHESTLSTYELRIESTGVFEKLVADVLQ
jgi:hypothetical protein